MTFKSARSIYSPLPVMATVSAVFIAGCSTTPTNTAATQTLPTSNQAPVFQRTAPVAQTQAVSNVPAAGAQYGASLLDEESLDELANLLEATDMKMVEDDKLAIQQAGNLWDRMRAGFSISQNKVDPRIDAQKSWFITRQDYINRLTARASRYLYHTIREAERRNIPTELALLPIIESSYDPTATSNANAAGMWQFIPSTGRIYGLKQTPSYDGRRDVVESTRAAYDFLTSLYNQFGSWELALAAYNAGPGRVRQAIESNERLGLPTDFWSLNLPKETMSYVPRFLAVAQIIANTDGYNVYLPAIANRQHFRSVPVNYGVSLNQVSQLTGVSLEELRVLNPALIAARVDPAGPNRVIIPNQVSTQLDARLSQLGSGDSIDGYAPNIPDNQYNQMSKSAEGLADFATQARAPQQTSNYIAPVTPAATPATPEQKRVINNQFANANVLPTTSASLTQNATIIQEPPLSPEEKQFIADQIRQQSPRVGEVVSSVDGNVRLEAIQTQQSILEATGKDKRISFENPVVAARNNTNTTTPVVTSNKPQGKRTTYTVQRGDTLTNIATRANVNWRDIADWNQINPNATLMAGSKLYLYNARPIKPLAQSATQTKNTDQDNAKPNTYIVRSGDTLIGTANRVGLSVSRLAKYNGLTTNARLRTGQKLWLIPGMVKSSEPTTTTSKPSNQYKGSTQRYTVKRGESLIGLAKRYGVSVSTLAAMNDLSTSEQLLIGQRLEVPNSSSSSSSQTATVSNKPSKPSTSTQSTANTYKGPITRYKVKSGDTLIGLANKLGVSRTLIAQLNGFATNYRLQIGQTIKLPVSSQVVATKVENKTATYTVKSGDTLIGLANKFGISVSNLAAANGLTTQSKVRIGQRLKVPAVGSKVVQSTKTKPTVQSKPKAQTASSSSPTSYKVQSGDTLLGLANKFGVSVSNLAAANGLTTQSQVRIGQNLSIPTKGSVTKQPAAKPKTVATQNYTVKSGDSLIGLARRYKVPVSDLASINGISNTTGLRIGQRLKVPKGSVPTKQSSQSSNSSSSSKSTSSSTSKSSGGRYIVKSGDTLIGLAAKNGMSTSTLAKANGISSNTQLRIGQRLTIPATTTEYKVKSGDSLIGLARKYGITTSQLAELNGIESNKELMIGQTLLVPVN